MDLLFIIFILVVFTTFFGTNESFHTSDRSTSGDFHTNGYTKKWDKLPHSRPAGYPTADKPWFMTERQKQQGDGLPYSSYGDYKYF